MNADAARLEADLQCLTDFERTVLKLSYGAGLSQSEIAQQMLLSEQAVRTIIGRAMIKLGDFITGWPSRQTRAESLVLGE